MTEILPEFDAATNQGALEAADAGIVVYTKDNCQVCRLTKRMLTEQGVDFTEININRHPEVIDYLKDKGYLSVPVTEINFGESFAGFRPEKIKEFASKLNTPPIPSKSRSISL